ncbi:hypothetical protein B0H19DRAFT_1062098 [Mycena capillaripes]|nr:hypothetical protein B0H19DRAFT_1062098 [Mycena capillaripes]
MYPFPPNKIGQPVSNQPRQVRQISIHTHFAPTAKEIVNYVQERSTSSEFVSKSEGHAQMWPMLQRCLQSRRMRATGRFLPNSRVVEMELDSITVTGLHGLKMRISDFYSALGFIITETDPYKSYTRIPGKNNVVRDTAARKEGIHVSILAHYTKWIDVLSKSRDYFIDSAPSTTCIMYHRTAVPGSEPPFIPAAVFPNLSEAHKDTALRLQQENIQGFVQGLIINGASPRELVGHDVHFGHCAEVLALLYMFDPMTASGCYLHGMAATVAPLRAMNQYDETLFKTRLIKACINCQYLIRAINDKMGLRSAGTPALHYSDRAAVPPTHLPPPTQCENAANVLVLQYGMHGDGLEASSKLPTLPEVRLLQEICNIGLWWL